MNPIIRNSFLCGLVLFLLTVFFTLSRSLSLLIIFSNVLPGFFYGIVLSDLLKHRFDYKRYVFILLSAGLFILNVRIATGFSIIGHDTVKCFPIGSVLGSIILLILYKFLIDQSILMLKGLLMAVCAGLIASILPTIVGKYEHVIHNYIFRGDIYYICILSVLLVWQTLFGVVIVLSKKRETPQHPDTTIN